MVAAKQARAEASEFRRYVAAQYQRADRAALVAADHADSAATGPEHLRQLHLRMAHLHRETEARHRATAKLAESHASRLYRWLRLGGSENDASAPTFMDAVLGALGTPSASATLRGLRRESVVVAASDATARAANTLEIVLAEGPVTEVAAGGNPTAGAGEELLKRWPRFGPAAAELGVYAVSAAPLALPSTRLGALCAYGTEPAARRSDLQTTVEVADALTHLLLTAHRGPRDASLNRQALLGMFESEAEVHQAVGMISVQCDCSVEDAMALLTARAFADEMSVPEISNRVICGNISI